jgi:hypothetical protein
MTLLVALAPLLSPTWAYGGQPSASDVQAPEVLGWDWSRTHRFALESQVQLPLFMWFATPFNRQARVTAFDIKLVTSCGNAQVETKRVVEVDCTIEDLALSAAGMPQEKGLLQPILEELDELLTGAVVQMRMNDEGRVVNLDLEGVYRRNLRTGRITENMRLVVTRAFAGLDLQLPGTDDRQWVQYDNWLLRAPSVVGTAGSAQVVHSFANTEEVPGYVTIVSAGRAMIIPGEGRNQFDTRMSSTATFDLRTGRIADRNWAVLGGPTASSWIAQGAAGYPYAQQGRVVALTESEPWNVGESLELEPGQVQSAIQQSMNLGAAYR